MPSSPLNSLNNSPASALSMQIKNTLLLFLSFLIVTPSNAQTMLDWPDFRRQLLSNHPLALQANLYQRQARAEWLRAKGGFDVKAYADAERKDFKGKTYFQYAEAGLKMPTWFGLSLKANYNWATGIYINPARTLPERGQFLAGINWTLGQGLRIDQRRADLFAARAGLTQGEALNWLYLNDLMLDGAKAYWTWVLNQNQLRIFRDARAQALLRFEGIRDNFRFGDKAAIDTTETLTQLQQRDLDLAEAQLDSLRAVFELTNFSWNAEQVVMPDLAAYKAPVLNTVGVRAYTDAEVSELVNNARLSHPKMRAIDAKLRILEVEQRLKQEKTKPIADIDYSFLGNGFQFIDTRTPQGSPGVFVGGTKWAFTFSYPIQNRKARGDLQLTQVKINQLALDQTQIRQEIETKVRQYATQINVLAAQIRTYSALVTNLRALLDGEMEKFRLGDSSIFLINSREQKWLEVQIKYLKMLSEYRKAEAGLLWASGQLAN